MTAMPSLAPVARRRSFADLGVQVKILIAVFVPVLVALAVGLVGLRALSNTSKAAEHMYASNVASINAAGELTSAIAETRLDAANQAISQDLPTQTKNIASFDTDRQDFAAAMTAYRASSPAGAPDIVAELQTTYDAYVQIAETKLRPPALSTTL